MSVCIQMRIRRRVWTETGTETSVDMYGYGCRLVLVRTLVYDNAGVDR